MRRGGAASTRFIILSYFSLYSQHDCSLIVARLRFNCGRSRVLAYHRLLTIINHRLLTISIVYYNLLSLYALVIKQELKSFSLYRS